VYRVHNNSFKSICVVVAKTITYIKARQEITVHSRRSVYEQLLQQISCCLTVQPYCLFAVLLVTAILCGKYMMIVVKLDQN